MWLKNSILWRTCRLAGISGWMQKDLRIRGVIPTNWIAISSDIVQNPLRRPFNTLRHSNLRSHSFSRCSRSLLFDLDVSRSNPSSRALTQSENGYEDGIWITCLRVARRLRANGLRRLLKSPANFAFRAVEAENILAWRKLNDEAAFWYLLMRND